MDGGLRKQFVSSSVVLGGLCGYLYFHKLLPLWLLVIVLAVVALGFYDYFQIKHAIRRNFPIVGRARYLLEAIRPEIHQYFVESDLGGRPFNREQRSIIYRRAKGVRDTVPFGTLKDVNEVGYEWINHSVLPVHVDAPSLRVTIGGKNCTQPYSASLLNVSAMSYGSLSKNAVLALNGGAKDGNFAHNTGEGGVSPHHLQLGGDLIWQIGTGYFGCRSETGGFSPERYKSTVNNPIIKMIELKVSQGAKPAHGGILPGSKVTKEIAEIRGVNIGETVYSPPSHSVFSTPIGLLEFIQTLRELSGGKPVGFKICIGKRREFLAICKAMLKTGILPDFITVDGGEGGTGAAPLDFSNRVGAPGVESLVFVHNALTGFGLRNDLRVIATGKISSAFEMLKVLALGADCAYSARAMLMAIGCIQALKCNANTCPTGVATQDPNLVAGLVVSDKRKRLTSFHKETMGSLAELIGAMGVSDVSELRPWHIMKRVAPNCVKHYGELYHYVKSGSFLGGAIPEEYKRAVEAAQPDSFRHIEDVASRPAVT